MKTYEEICNEIAKEWGCNSWKEMDWYHVNYSGEYPINGQYAQEALTQEAAERYANYKAEKAFEEAKKLTIKRAIQCAEEDFGLDNFHGRMRPFTITNPYKQK